MRSLRKTGLLGTLLGLHLIVSCVFYVFYSSLSYPLPEVCGFIFLISGFIGFGLFIGGIISLITSFFIKGKDETDSIEDEEERSWWFRPMRLSGNYKEHIISGMICVFITIISFMITVYGSHVLGGRYTYEDNKWLCICHPIILVFLIMAILFFKKAYDKWKKEEEPQHKKTSPKATDKPIKKKCPKCGWPAKWMSEKKHFYCDYCKKKIKS